jgi:DNA-binding helix-hairpin-helix protein with protein kinase domain
MSRISQTSSAEAIRFTQRVFHTTQNEPIRLTRLLGRGGEGEVFEIQGRDDLVAKVYHEPPPPKKAEKLLALARLGNERLFNLSAWPVDALRDGPEGEVVGFLMKKVSQAEEVHALHSPKSRLQKFPEASWAFLVYVAGNIARAVAAMHEQGYVIGDLNPKNILVTRKATVLLLDVDSFQVRAEGKTYRCEGGFPEYTPPELQGVAFREVDRRPEHDSFGLAVVIFQLLFMGRHPFSGRYLGAEEMPLERAIREYRFAYGADAQVRRMRQPPGTLALDSMPAPLVDLFRRAFLSADRPRALEWIEPLDALAKSLKKCGLHNGHYYYQQLRECPWCGIETQAHVLLFNFLLPGGDSPREQFRLDEIWSEIVKVEPPGTSLIPQDEKLKRLKPSADVAAVQRTRRSDMFLSISFASAFSLLIALYTDFPASVPLLFVVAFVARRVSKAEDFSVDLFQTITTFSSRIKNPDDPLIQKVRWRHVQAESGKRRIQDRYDQEAGNEDWGAKRDELKSQKEAYAKLAGSRKAKLTQWETSARKKQLELFLDQFRIDESEIGKIDSTIKTTLLSHGVETAADLTDESLQQLALGRWRSDQLLEWRRDLERNFVFDSKNDLSQQARLAVEKEFDAMRLCLERDLSRGAQQLLRMKMEIETNRRRLLPGLLNASYELAQAEKDLEIVVKRNTFKPILIVILIVFLLGKLSFYDWSAPPRPHIAPPAGAKAEPTADQGISEKNRDEEMARTLYHQGQQLFEQKRFAEAVPRFQRAIDLYPSLNSAYDGLGAALYKLKRYDESALAWKRLIGYEQSFRSHYGLGLVYYAQKNWEGAETEFDYATAYCNPSDWEDNYTVAYDYLAQSRAKLGRAKAQIEGIKKRPEAPMQLPLNRFELATLYLWTGNTQAAIEQYMVLKVASPQLAIKLKGLMKKHNIRTPLNL